MLTPAFQPRRAVTIWWGSLPGHSCGTAPDSHRRSLRCAAHHSQPRLWALGAGPTLRRVARGESIVLLNTGHGKGKSSAAFGVMARGWARGWRVGVVQFIKGGKWKTGERKLADHLGVEWHTLGDGFTWESTDLDETAAKGRHAWEVAAGKLASGDYDLLILDELTYAVKYEWVPVDEVVAGIRDRAEGTNVVMTGRDAADELVELADTVTEMRKVKHAFDRGIKGKKGIEY
jgi:cob(I)alamin adenosyltransferase